MGSVTIIVIIPLFILILLGSSLIGAVTGGDRTKVVLPYEPVKGIVWECDIQDDCPIELVETETDSKTQVFYFKSKFGMEMVRDFAELAKELITKEYSDQEYTYGDYYEIIFTDENGNEQKYYAKSEVNTESIYIDKAVFYAPDEYFAFDYTVTAQQPIEGEYGWRCEDYPYRTEGYKFEGSPTKTFTIVHTGDYLENGKYRYEVEYVPIKGIENETEKVEIIYTITDGEVEILEEIHTVKENTANT